MKLHDGPLVKWQTDGEAWQVGCVMVDPDGDQFTIPLKKPLKLVRHWPTGELEFVAAVKLQPREARE